MHMEQFTPQESIKHNQKKIEERENMDAGQKLVRYLLSNVKPTEHVQRYDNSSNEPSKREKLNQSVAEHVASMTEILEFLLAQEPEGTFKELDTEKMRKMIRFHDRHEIHIDDVVYKDDGYHEQEAEAEDANAAFLHKVGFLDAPAIMTEYKQGESNEAILVKAIDRLEAYVTKMYGDPQPIIENRADDAVEIAEKIKHLSPTLYKASILAIRWLQTQPDEEEAT
jgi:5'-deoxynucleotidase YfbR-like HD superfamily hydrolase